jgi:cell division ATPase FtsA
MEHPRSYSLVDIGRDTVKAAVVLLPSAGATPQLVGFGSAQTGDHDISGGRLEAEAVVSPVNIALTLAEDSTEAVVGHKIVPDNVIFALPGQATTGKLFTVRQTRPHPAKPISKKELKHLHSRADQVVIEGLRHLPVEGGQWQALAVNEVALRLDNHLVLEGLGRKGQELALSVFGVAAQAGAKRGLETLARLLDLVEVNIIAAPQALASVVPVAEAIVLDVGFSGTMLGLIRGDALVASQWLPFGGNFFSQTLTQPLELTPAEATQLKHDWITGEVDAETATYLDSRLAEARQRWYEMVLATLLKESRQQPLPWKIYLTGGGSLLPGLEPLLRANPEYFDRLPEVSRLGQSPLPHLTDLTGTVDYNFYAVTLGLAVGLSL